MNFGALSATSAAPPPSDAVVEASSIAIVGRAIIPENLTSTADGTLYIGSYERGGIYRAGRGERTASLWITPAQLESGRTLGLWAEDRENRLLACIIERPVPPESKPNASSIKAFDLATGQLEASYPLADGGICNDLTLASDGTTYTTDMAGRIFRRRAGESAFTLWFEDGGLTGADGVALLDDGSLLVGRIRPGTLHRISMDASGAAAALVDIPLDRPLDRPDGIRRVAPNRLLVAEGGGRLTELTLRDDRGITRIVRQGLAENPSGVTLVGDTAYVSLANWASRDPKADRGSYTVAAIRYQPE